MKLQANTIKSSTLSRHWSLRRCCCLHRNGRKHEQSCLKGSAPLFTSWVTSAPLLKVIVHIGQFRKSKSNVNWQDVFSLVKICLACNSAEPSDSQSVQSTNCYLQDKIHAYSCYSRLLVNHLYRRVRVTRPPPLDTRAHPHSWCTLTQCCPDHWKQHRWQGPCLVHASLAAADRYQNSQCCSLPTWKTTSKFPTNSMTHAFLLE